MDIIVSNMDSTPIYEQITRQIKAKILGGELQPGEALPSMRLLAKELRISVITTKRAYEELEREGPYHQPDRTRQLCCTGQQRTFAGSAASARWKTT